MDVAQTLPVTLPYTGQDPQVLAAQSRNGRDPKAIDSVAQGFESMFTSLLIKQMRQSLQPNSMFGQDTGDVMGGLFDLYLGQHMAQAGRVRDWPHGEAAIDAAGTQGMNPLLDGCLALIGREEAFLARLHEGLRRLQVVLAHFDLESQAEAQRLQQELARAAMTMRQERQEWRGAGRALAQHAGRECHAQHGRRSAGAGRDAGANGPRTLAAAGGGGLAAEPVGGRAVADVSLLPAAASSRS